MAEVKYFDKQFANSALFVFNTAVGNINLLNGIVQGTDVDERIGRNVLLERLFIRGGIAKSATQTGESILRIIIVLDRQANGGTPAITDILTADSIHSMYNEDNSERFRILFDEMEPFGSIENTSYPVYLEIPIEEEATFTTGVGTGVAADIKTNSLWMVCFAQQTLQTASPDGAINTRVYFCDT